MPSDLRPGVAVRIGGDGEFAGRTGTAVRLGGRRQWFVKTNGGHQAGVWVHESDPTPETDDSVDTADQLGGYGDSVHTAAHHQHTNA
jgi:hypothetical protein